MTLLNPPITTFSTSNILYFRGLIQRATIMKSLNDYDFTYKYYRPRIIITQYNWSFHQLLHKHNPSTTI